MARSFTCNAYARLISPLFLAILLASLSYQSLNAFEFQCYQRFRHAKPYVFIQYKARANEFDFYEVNKKCIADLEIEIQFKRGPAVLLEKKFSKVLWLRDYEDPSQTWVLDSLSLFQLEFGEYEVHFSIEQTSRVLYQQINFLYEEPWYKVNLYDIALLDASFFPVLRYLPENQEDLWLRFEFDSFHSFPLTIRTQLFTRQSEVSNPYAIAYQSVYQNVSTVNLRNGKNFKWVKIPLKELEGNQYFLEVNFFEEEQFILSKRIELQYEHSKAIQQRRTMELVEQFKDFNIALPAERIKHYEDFNEIYRYLKTVIKEANGDREKALVLLDYGKPDKVMKSRKGEEWVYYKYNKKVSFPR